MAHDRESGAPLKIFRRAVLPVLMGCASGLAQAESAMPSEAIARQFAGIIEAASRRHGVDADLVRAVVFVESSYDPQAMSSQGALGLMQLMPETARRYGVKDPWDPAQNVEGGVRFLKELLVQFDQDTQLALAAYNSGAGAVIRAGYRVPANAETLAFVPRVLEHYRNLQPVQQPDAAQSPAMLALEPALDISALDPVRGDIFDRESPAPDRGKVVVGILSGRRPRRWHPARIRGSGAPPMLIGNGTPEVAHDKAGSPRSATRLPLRRKTRAATSGTLRKRTPGG
jgi:hypothetical protein